MKPAGCAFLGIIGFLFIGLICVCAAVDIAARGLGPDVFSSWELSGTSVDVDTDDPVEHGEALYVENCSGCHSIDGSTRVGPTLQGLYGSEIETEAGDTIMVDDDHLQTAITDPGADVREGYPGVMPSFGGMSDDEIDALIAFIRSLE